MEERGTLRTAVPASAFSGCRGDGSVMGWESAEGAAGEEELPRLAAPLMREPSPLPRAFFCIIVAGSVRAWQGEVNPGT